MIKIALIGAGSIVFSGRLVSDLVHAAKAIRGAYVTLMDVSKERLAVVHRLATAYAKKTGASLTFVPTLSREEALRGADFVIHTAFVPGYQRMEAERAIAERLGYYRGLGDRVSDYYGGIGAYAQLRFLLELAEDMERLCPNAWLLVSANPVLEGTTLIGRRTSVRVVGMCHGSAKFWDVVRILGLRPESVEFSVAGLNHCIWLTRFCYEGEDAYPFLDQWLQTEATRFWQSEEYLFNPQNYQMSPAAFALYRMFGLFPIGDTVRSASPWWFHVDLAAKKKWFPAGGVDSEIGWTCRLSENLSLLRKLARVTPEEPPFFHEFFPTAPSAEPHVPFIVARVTGKPTRLVLNVRNEGLIPGLPEDVFVEVPCRVDAASIEPEPVDPLPRRLLLYVLLPRWLRMERVLQAFEDGDRTSLVLEVAEDHRTQSWNQAVQAVEALLALPWNEEARRHYRGPEQGWNWGLPEGDLRKD